ncbi:glutamate racemase [Candidatus Daviesbacteria bacterium RIFCSPLOWO2_01_FULL_39_12]|uniref:Glutamate racemase n=1 Tax=Candidatus Daviesbacteria bacterium RIFCSPLOWO2_01_FULL_39_12 TaxID=1797785 RepID=A0A1F5KLX9_9BACT|nr:MAG: glutamate racemase [Candidatus Daviesbacteria bacterium RIFCSPLOWO2_01_FULL_39_12]
MRNNPIGIFDSGIGGLTVAKEIIKQLPNESLIYIGDTARVPYGTRSKEIVTKFALELVDFLLRRKVKCLVVACNTISAYALSEIKKVSPVPVVDVLQPVVDRAIKTTKNKKIGVIGTQGTIQNRAYDLAIKKLDPKIKIVSCACPLFVPMAEEGLNHHQATKLIAREYLSDVIGGGIDTLILGCTHYPLLDEAIREAVGKGVILIDSAGPTVTELKKVLSEKNLLSNNPYLKYEFFVTDVPERVYQVASRFFGSDLKDKIRKVTL